MHTLTRTRASVHKRTDLTGRLRARMSSSRLRRCQNRMYDTCAAATALRQRWGEPNLSADVGGVRVLAGGKRHSRNEATPRADVRGVSRVPVQMWEGRVRAWRRLRMGPCTCKGARQAIADVSKACGQSEGRWRDPRRVISYSALIFIAENPRRPCSECAFCSSILDRSLR